MNKKIKKLFSPVNISVYIVILVLLVLTVVGVCNATSYGMGGEDYMQSDNLAYKAKVSGDIIGGGRLTDGNKGNSARVRKLNGAKIVIDLGNEQVINSVLLREDGLNCKNFVIETSKDGESYVTVHKGDKIEYQRLCTFPENTGRFIRITLDGSKEAVVLREVEAYREVKNAENFRVCGYYSDGWQNIYLDNSLTEEEQNAKADELIHNYNIDNLTHYFMYSGVGYDSAGNVFISQDAADNNLRKQALKKLVSRIKLKSNRDIKLLLTIGVSTGYEPFLTAIDANRAAFMKNLVEFCREIGFDGLDIDYEFPVTKRDYELFDKFLIDFKGYMRENLSETALLSCAFGTRDIHYSEEAINALDMVNCMTYDIFDQDGYHSSFWGGCVQGGFYLESVGFKKDQINIGIPFYGTQIDALMEQYLYSNLVDTDYYKNVYEINDYLGKPALAYYNSPSIARDKTAYALLAGYGGVMTWHSSIDKPIDHPHSLWRAINDAVKQFGGAL